MFLYRPLASLPRDAESAEILFIVFSPERGEILYSKPSGQKQHMVFNIVDIFIRIPLSGILIKNSFSAFFASCGEFVFGQE